MIIALTGKKGAGKDTVAAHLIKEHGFERKAFADPLKRSVAALFDIPFTDVDKFKNDTKVCVELLEYASESDANIHDANYAFVKGFTFREFLQRYGTESHRDVFGENFWLDYTLPLDGFYYQGKNIVVTDCRFDNEAKRVKKVNGQIVEVFRPGLPEQDPHRSESGLSYVEADYTFMNTGTIDDIGKKVDVMLEDIYGMVKS